MKFRTKPVVFEAIQWTGDNYPEVSKFAGGPGETGLRAYEFKDGERLLRIHTTEGVKLCAPGDWIIKYAKGKFYPWKKNVFEAAFEPIEDTKPRKTFAERIEEELKKQRSTPAKD